MRIDALTSANPVLPSESAAGAANVANEAPAVDFESVFGHMVTEANAMSVAADEKAQALAAGVSDDIHGTMIASKEAEISVKLVGAIRNKVLDAFHEIWRTSV